MDESIIECICCGKTALTTDMFEEHCNDCINVLDCATCGSEYREVIGGNTTMCPACEFEQEMCVDEHQQEK